MYGVLVHHGAGDIGAAASSHPSHNRSISLGPPQSITPRDHLAKAKSTTNLRKMTATGSAIPPAQNAVSPEASFRTIADPRTSSTSDLSRSGSSSSHHPDLNTEVAALSDKLIRAVNHQTSLDDTLAQTRHELEASRARIARLEAEAKEYEEKISRGDLVTREAAQQLNSKISAELADEKKQKNMVQQEKRGIENELENLTASLFDEANKMVASANMERDAVEKKNQQLRDQIKDGESLIASQTEQLTELKTLMQQISSNDYRKELDSPNVSVAPSSPGLGRDNSDLARLLEAMNLSAVTPEHGEIAPSPSTTLTHLVKPLCRTDVPAYEDFRNLVQTSVVRSHNPSHAPSRAGSGSYSGLNVMGLGSLSNNSNFNVAQNSQPATSKLANSPTLPGSFSPSPDVRGPIPLRETRFFKRIMSEDVEPTLRLDLSPTISWLNRRSILAALADSALIVEPIAEASLKLYGKYTACALCGECRKEGQNPRTHAMRVREGEGATKWSICKLCLEKVRGVGDLVAYVRMIREGVVKVGDKKEEEEVWAELIRLRERLFWARMAGGVVPAFLPSTKDSPVTTAEKGDVAADADKENWEPALAEAAGSPRRDSGEGVDSDESKSEKEAQLQLQQGLDESLTTFENYKSKRTSLGSTVAATTPPNTPPKKRESGGFPKISIPRIPQSFWESQVNSLR